MRLSDMRTRLRAALFDRYDDIYPVERIDGWLNDSLKHIANWADALDQGLFFHTGPAVTVASNDDETIVPFYGGGNALIGALNATVFRFRRALLVERTNAGVSKKEVLPLTLVNYEERFAHRPESDAELPPCYVFAENLHVLRPIANVLIRMRYVYSLPPMIAPADTPGQSNGQGEYNALPEEYHPLIVSYAAVKARVGMNVDATAQRDIYQEERDELSATLHKRRGARTGGRP